MIKETLDNCADLSYKEYCEYIVKRLDKVVREEKIEQKRQFELSKEILVLILENRKRILARVKTRSRNNEALKRICNNEKNKVQDIVEMAKGN